MENERNTTFSPLFNELKIYRKEIEKVKNMKLKSHNTNYAFIQKLYVKMLIPKVLQK